MNFDIKFDFQRRDRLGLIEAIWGQDKSIDQLERLSENVLSKNEVVFITRINSEKANYLLDLYDDARFHEEANCLTIGENLKKIINKMFQDFNATPIDPIKWESSIYKPTPTIIEAAQALYQGHDVKEISRSDAGAENLTRSTDKIKQIISDSKKNRKKSICFLTGVPGSGKTLAGLNIANETQKFEDDEHAVFLSGNGPLVKVLREALARYEVENSVTTITKAEALRKSSTFIQNIHHYRDDALNNPSPPIEKVVIFDESQRAWDLEQTAYFFSWKKKKSKIMKNYYGKMVLFLIQDMQVV